MTNPEHPEQAADLNGALGLGDEPEQRDISDPDTPEWQKHTRH
ncbi:hypothetical protein [Segniliparus rugosus]|uniref:Uncharacterized protein n=1 Tax=Segniliparus rugosus (strain ATCC BAA-974 / DSM 45345 / CCUG 50838 / CIP 108380 / JCM 13579 / CDC 945) TaxID=679197 RepID=U1M211_SEGRC|nr:hypothetical protein [Segniliparus rugosus]ERG69130.1 hypothetical protein HMPREF9336_04274 [Segniliparus rugosus ATCC BAA-974]